MADDVLASFMVALGFRVDQSSQNAAKKSVADYERAVREAEKRIEDARWAGAQTEAEVAKLSRESNLKLAREALEGAKAREKQEAEVAAKRRERVKEFEAGMGRMALAVTAAATAIGYAFEKMTAGFDHLGFVSARTGATVASLKSLQYAFSQTGGNAQQAVGAVENFARALRTNQGLKGFVKGLGVDTSKDAADQLLDTVHILKGQGYQNGSQLAEMLGISEENFNLISRQEEAIRSYRTEYSETTKRLGVNSEDATQAAMAFQRALTKLQAIGSALADKLLIQLAPALERIAKGFSDWIEANPEKVEKIIRNITDGIVWFMTKLTALVDWFGGDGGEQFLKRWDEIVGRIKAIGDSFDYVSKKFKTIDDWLADSKIYQFFKWYAGGGVMTFSPAGALYDKATGQGGSAPEGGDTRTFLERHLPKILGGKDAPDSGPVASGPAPAGSDAGNLTKLIEQEARRAGIDPRIMEGIRHGESTHRRNGNNPAGAYDHNGGTPGRPESSWGPFQLNRLRGLGQQFEKETGLDVRDHRTIAAQARWVAEYIAKQRRRNPNYSPYPTWQGYKGNKNADPSWGDSGYVPTPRAAPAPARGLPNATPGGFDVNRIDPGNLTPAAPLGSGSVTNNSSSNRAVNQTNNVNVKIEGSRDPQEHGRMMESSLGRIHGLWQENAQSALV